MKRCYADGKRAPLLLGVLLCCLVNACATRQPIVYETWSSRLTDMGRSPSTADDVSLLLSSPPHRCDELVHGQDALRQGKLAGRVGGKQEHRGGHTGDDERQALGSEGEENHDTRRAGTEARQQRANIEAVAQGGPEGDYRQ